MNLIEVETQNKIKLLAKDTVCKYYGIDIAKRTRKREYVLARSMYYKLLRENTKMSFQEIADSFNKDHATAMHSIKQLDGYMETELVLRADFAELQSIFLDGVDSQLLNKYDGEVQEESAQYLRLLQDFYQLKRRYNKLKEDHRKSIEMNSVLNSNYKSLFDRHRERENYYRRNGFIIK